MFVCQNVQKRVSLEFAPILTNVRVSMGTLTMKNRLKNVCRNVTNPVRTGSVRAPTRANVKTAFKSTREIKKRVSLKTLL